MAVATLSEFPSSFISGDTLRTTISDADYPSTEWTLKVLLSSSTETKSFTATAVGGSSTAYTLVISAADSAKIPPGFYIVSYRFTETASGEIQTGEDQFSVTVYANPAVVAAKTVARQTLEAMEAAFLKLAGGSNISVSFNGQSFTKRNLKDFQDALERQRAVVNAESQQLSGHRRISRVLHPL